MSVYCDKHKDEKCVKCFTNELHEETLNVLHSLNQTLQEIRNILNYPIRVDIQK